MRIISEIRNFQISNFKFSNQLFNPKRETQNTKRETQNTKHEKLFLLHVFGNQKKFSIFAVRLLSQCKSSFLLVETICVCAD